MRFSERMGFKPPKLMQSDDLDAETRNRLWDVARTHLNKSNDYRTASSANCIKFNCVFLKNSIDDLPTNHSSFLQKCRDLFSEQEYYEVLDFVEYFSTQDSSLLPRFNAIFEEERVPFRFISGVLAAISDRAEADSIEKSLQVGDQFAGARSHITAALAAFSKRPTADYRNAIREAISAVESAAKVVAGNEKADLGAALKAIDKTHGMHPAFKDAVTKLYAYTSDEKGIRHALLEEDARVDEADAHFMIVTCAAFVNFLVQRYGR